MLRTWTMKCIKKYDPCYGYKIINEGDIIQVKELDKYGHDLRLIQCSNNDTYQGYGMRISEYELKTYFKGIAVTSGQ